MSSIVANSATDFETDPSQWTTKFVPFKSTHPSPYFPPIVQRNDSSTYASSKLQTDYQHCTTHS